MEYRKLPKGEEELSVLGIGTAYIRDAGDEEMERTLALALENGVNFFDLASAEAGVFPVFGRAMSGAREKIYLQVHFGAEYTTGKYGWTTDLERIKRSVDWQLENLRTDYIDFGFLHCIDEESALETVVSGGVLEHVRQLKREGVVRRIALSSHTPRIAKKVVEQGWIDLLMFSINPGYDYRHGEYAFGEVDERLELYRLCEAKGVGISVMKPFSGGQLLDAKTSPFGQSLTEYQCLQYALDKPGVLTVVPGVRGTADLRRLLGFFDAPPAERDYAILGTFAPQDAAGKCVYCNHCQPCPEGLDVGLINKYYDLSRAGDILAKGHYEKLEKKAGDCTDCGHCDERCPFHVAQGARMEEIRDYFGA